MKKSQLWSLTAAALLAAVTLEALPIIKAQILRRITDILYYPYQIFPKILSLKLHI